MPDPDRRSFIAQLVHSFLEMAREWRLLRADLTAPSSPREHDTAIPARPTPSEINLAQLQELPPTHLFFLGTFRKPRPAQAYPALPADFPDKDWETFLAATPQQVTEQLLARGALVRADLVTHLVDQFTQDELQAMLKTHGLPVSGPKAELARRLAQADAAAMWAAIGDVTLLEYTPWAWQAAQQTLQRAAAQAEPGATPEQAATTKLKTALLWLGAASAAGIVGNRADATFLALQELAMNWGLGEIDAGPISPVPPPQPASPLPAPASPLPTPDRDNTRRTYTPRLDFDWVTIPAGEFLLGSDKAKDKDAYDDELPQHKLYLAAYRIARVPVTVAQFEQFVRAMNYKTTAEVKGSAWNWAEKDGKWQWVEIKGAFWARPRGPQSDVQQKANHPVTCVSWYDAQAFCTWAGVRLPSEAEWERAARGTDGRIYPWGNDAPDRSRCNFNMHVQDTTPVDAYPQGASPEGLLDMAGNVWEWTISLWRKDVNQPDFGYPYTAGDGRENLAAGDDVPRVVRGGSFDDIHRLVRCAARGYYFLNFRFDDLGFRVVAPGS